MAIGNASIEYVDTQISNISSFTNDGTQVIKSKSITSDGGKFITDGSGNLSIYGSLVVENGEQVKFVDSTGNSYVYAFQNSTNNRLEFHANGSATGDVQFPGVVYSAGVNTSGEISLDSGKITTDGKGSLTVGVNLNASGYVMTPQAVVTTSLMVGSSSQFSVDGTGAVQSHGASSFYSGLTTSTLNCTGTMIVNGVMQIDGGFAAQGTCTAPTPATSDNSQNVATTAWVKAQNATDDVTSILMDTDNSDPTLATILGDGPSNTSTVSLYTGSTDPTLASKTDLPLFLMNQFSKYATLAYLSSIRGIKNADISASGSSMTLTIPTDNVVLTLANTGTTSASISYSVTSGSISPVDIRRVTMYGGGSNETYTMDGGTLTTTPTVVDNLIYTQSNDTSAHFIRVNGNSYVVTVWISGSGARSSLIYEKFV